MHGGHCDGCCGARREAKLLAEDCRAPKRHGEEEAVVGGDERPQRERREAECVSNGWGGGGEGMRGWEEVMNRKLRSFAHPMRPMAGMAETKPEERPPAADPAVWTEQFSRRPKCTRLVRPKMRSATRSYATMMA